MGSVRRGVGPILTRMAAGQPKGKTPSFAEQFGERLRAAREKRGMTQQELAEALGIHRPRITKYESGAMFPEGETLAAIGVVLEMSLDELILGRPSQQPDEIRDARLRASIRELERLRDRRLVNVVVAVVDALVAQEQHAAVHERVSQHRKK